MIWDPNLVHGLVKIGERLRHSLFTFLLTCNHKQLDKHVENLHKNVELAVLVGIFKETVHWYQLDMQSSSQNNAVEIVRYTKEKRKS